MLPEYDFRGGVRGKYHAQMMNEEVHLPEHARIPPEWLAEYEAAAKRPLEQRWKYAFIKTYKPVMDDAEYRSWDSTADYRRWCEEHLPDWLGYGRV